jgi:hypothetical protein
MNKLKVKFLLAICLLPILVSIQVFSQNQIPHQLIIIGEEKQSSSAFSTFINKELSAKEYEVAFNVDQLSRVEFTSGAYFYQLEIRDSETSQPDGNASSGQEIIRAKKRFLFNNIISIFF